MAEFFIPFVRKLQNDALVSCLAKSACYGVKISELIWEQTNQILVRFTKG